MLSGQSFLVTGGTGSFGSTVTKALLHSDCREIRVFSRDEKKQDDMRKELSDHRISFHLGDVRDIDSVRQATVGVDYVFHAAALKQVPSCEFFPLEAVKTNVLGTENVLDAAVGAGASRIVCLSTDKAAYPVNAMGISKAMMERVFMAKSRTASAAGAVISGTRYGNVLASRGSVVPLFINQCLEGVDITVTDPSMSRFLMTLDDAVDLVMHGFEKSNPGDLMIQKSPSAFVGDLAEAVRRMFNPKVGIRVIGTRHGEKLHEVLMTREEAARAEDQGRYFRVAADNRDLNYGKYLEEGSPEASLALEYRSGEGDVLDIEQIQELLMQVPEVRRSLERGAPLQ